MLIISLVSFTMRGAAFSATVGVLVSIAIAIYAVIAHCCGFKCTYKPAFVLRRTAQLLVCVFLILIIVAECLIFSGFNSDTDTHADYAILMGAGLYGSTPSLALQTRMEAAKIWLDQNPSSIIVVSGGKGDDENLTEADAMYQWLTGQGISSDRILKEDTARDSVQNIRFSLDMLERHIGRSIEGQKVAVITNDFHLYRSRELVRAENCEPVGVSSTVPIFAYQLSNLFREFFSVLFMWMRL